MSSTCIIVESDPFIAKLLIRFAEECDCRVLHTQIGKEAVSLARIHQPILIIIDPELPGTIRGWEVIKDLKQNSITQTIPIIACSWLSEQETTQLAGNTDGYLQKPNLHFKDFEAQTTFAKKNKLSQFDQTSTRRSETENSEVN